MCEWCSCNDGSHHFLLLHFENTINILIFSLARFVCIVQFFICYIFLLPFAALFLCALQREMKFVEPRVMGNGAVLRNTVRQTYRTGAHLTNFYGIPIPENKSCVDYRTRCVIWMKCASSPASIHCLLIWWKTIKWINEPSEERKTRRIPVLHAVIRIIIITATDSTA